VLVAQRLAALVLGVEHDHARPVVLQVTLEERQRAFADRAEADHDDRSGDGRVNGPVGHSEPLQSISGVISAAGDKRKGGRAGIRHGRPIILTIYAARRRGFVTGCPVGTLTPAAPSSAPGTISRPSSRWRSNGPGMARRAVLSAVKPKRP